MNSLGRLTRDVLARIGDGKTRYALTPRRTKRIASGERVIRIRMITRRATRSMKKCPLCGGRLTALETRDLFGGETRGGKSCDECGFKMDPGRREPARYIFDLRW